MKKGIILTLFLVLTIIFTGCSSAGNKNLTIYDGVHPEEKLLYINASTDERDKRISSIADALTDAEETEEITFSRRPLYLVEISGDNGSNISAVVDIPSRKRTGTLGINDTDPVYFYYTENPDVIYKSSYDAKAFLECIHVNE